MKLPALKAAAKTQATATPSKIDIHRFERAFKKATRREADAQTGPVEAKEKKPKKSEHAVAPVLPLPVPPRLTDKTLALKPHKAAEPKTVDAVKKETEPKPAVAAPVEKTPVAVFTAPLDRPAETAPIAAPAPPLPVQPALLEDPSLRVSITANAARISVDSGENGRTSVQVQLKDGVTEVRAMGPAAALLYQHQNELRIELAQHGLAMGNFDLTQSNHGQTNERPEAPVPNPTKAPARATRMTSVTDSRLHVEA